MRDNSYELSYNEAIRLLGEGKIQDAEAQIRKAETFCRKTLEEDGANEDEIEDELALIRYQLLPKINYFWLEIYEQVLFLK